MTGLCGYVTLFATLESWSPRQRSEIIAALRAVAADIERGQATPTSYGWPIEVTKELDLRPVPEDT